jgi:hypothetical protein
MTNTASPHWSQRSYAWVLLVLAFALGVFAGLILAATWEVDRTARQSERSMADAIAEIRSRPTLRQSLDVIDQRLQAIEQRLTP